MANTKLYSLSQSDFDAHIKNGKFPLQQKLIFQALAASGKAMRGMDAVTLAEKEYGLITIQPHDILAAWYFSPKRRTAFVKLGEQNVVNESPEDRVTRLTAELEAKTNELVAAELAYLEQLKVIEAENAANESEPPVTEEDTQPESETEAEPETKKRKGKAA